MKTALCLGLILLGTRLLAADPAAAAQQAWAAAATPGPAHHALEPFVGEWRYTSRARIPGAPPVEDHGTARIRWANDGRFLFQEVTGTQMGAPMTAVNLIGYQNMRKQYVSVWSDNSSTAFFIASGDADETGRTFTFYGTSDDPATGQIGKMWRMVWRITGPDRIVFEHHDGSLPDGKSLMFETVYERVK